MEKVGLVGNLTKLPRAFKTLLSDPTVTVLASEYSSVDSCYYNFYKNFSNRDFDKVIVIYDENFAKYSEPDFGEPYVITPDSEFSGVCFLDKGQGKPTENPCFMFRLFLPLYVLCKSKSIDVEVIYDSGIQNAEDFINKKIKFFGGPEIIEGTHNETRLYGYHNSHNDFVENVQGRENLLIVLGDSWAVGDNKDTSKHWNPGQVEKSFGYLAAQEINADIVVCGAPGHSNQLALIEFIIWYLHNLNFTERYKNVNVLFSTTTEDRDFGISGNIGNWTAQRHLSDYIIMQKREKLFNENINAIETFVSFCKYMSVPYAFILNHGAHIHKYLIKHHPQNLVRPKAAFNYDALFTDTEYYSSCRHPSDKGNAFLAQEIIEYLKGS